MIALFQSPSPVSSFTFCNIVYLMSSVSLLMIRSLAISFSNPISQEIGVSIFISIIWWGGRGGRPETVMNLGVGRSKICGALLWFETDAKDGMIFREVQTYNGSRSPVCIVATCLLALSGRVNGFPPLL